LNFVEVPSRLLTIARDERDGSALAEQLNDGHQPAHRNVQFLRDASEYFRGKILSISHEESMLMVSGKAEEKSPPGK
jgi:hypothetical protein